MAYHQRNPTLHSNMNSQLDVGHIYRQARPPPPVPGPSGHPPRPVYAPAGYQQGPLPQRFQSPAPNYVQYRDGPPHAYRQQVPMPTHDTGQPCKMIRVHDQKPELQQPLRIDVRESSTAYTPQVENISPTFPSEIDDDTVRATKEDLLQQINKVDREIAQTEQKINQLRIQQAELEAKASRPEGEQAAEKEIELHTAKEKHQSLAQKIYAENRKKAAESHRMFDHLGPQIEVPIYNQPSDCPVFQENQRKHALLRPQLIKHLQRRAAERHEYERQTTVTYNKLMAEWQKKVEKLEKKRGKDSKHREEFEKMFPELRKQREDKERFNRVGARVKSEADMEEIMDGLHEQEMEDKKMRSYAVVPPILLDPVTRRYRYKNNNGVICDLSRTYKDNEFLNYWNPDEHDLFKEKYMQHPKNFGLVSSYLEKKTVKDCVLHYYLTKKHENYKQQLRKSRHGRTRASRNPPAAKVAPAAQPETPSGVTTRLQREQLQKQDPAPSTGPLVPAVPGPTVPAIAPVAADTSSVAAVAPLPVATPAATLPTPATTTGAPVDNMEVIPEASKKRRKGEKTVDDMESSDDEVQMATGPAGPHNCVVCKALVDSATQSRHLPRHHAYQYGLSESDVPHGGRVCNTCHCKAVRSRLVCPLPTCPNAKGLVKRLRTIPSKWADLPSEVLEPVVRDYQIPTGTTKCCSTCYSRISRRIAPHLAPGDDTLRWPEQDIEALKTALRKHGTGWSLVAELVPGRTRHQCKTFYFNSRKKYKLDAIVHEYYKTHFGEDRKPAVTDEEESGSSTSSCDEQPDAGPDTSDTASAGSPAKHSESSMASLSKEHRAHALQESDQGQPGDIIYAHLPGTSISTVSGPPSLSPPRTVEDLMANVIEKQLMKSPGGVAVGCTGPPTITSILSTDATGFKRSVGESLATLSVVGQAGQQEFQKEQNPNVVVLSIAPQSERMSENETLDLSMKKRDSAAEYAPANAAPHHPFTGPLHAKTSANAAQRDSPYYHTQTSKQPTLQTPHLVMSHSRGQHSSKDPPPGMPKLSPKVLPSSQSSKPGSITHGTPVQTSPRFDSVMRQIPQSQHKEGGSITHGTPVHHHLPAADKRQNVAYDYYKQRSSPATATSTTFSSPYPPVRPPTSYNLEPQLSSRQIIINDYITSQQMHGPRRVPMSVSDKTDSRVMTQLYYSSPPSNMYLPSRSPAENATTPPLRQGVIQRHNTIVPTSQAQPRGHGQQQGKVHYPPPGHEAFSSLVEAAVQQPSLPVPSNEKKSQYREHEGLGKTMADSISSSRIMEHGRMPGYPSAEQQHRMRQSQERDRIMTQQEQRYHQAAREQRETHHHQQQLQIQMQRQQQVRIEQQNQHARMEQQARLEHQQRMENSRHEQPGPPRAEYDKRHQAQLAAFIDAQQRVSGEREREKERGREWERADASRIMMSSYPRERQHLPPQRVSDSPSPSRGSATPGTAKTGSRNENEPTMTAASLIDAIITHQINQTSETGGPGSQAGPAQPRPGDRLFQGFPPPHAEPNGKVSPLKRSGSPLEREPVKSISLSDHIIDSIISKDFAASSYSHQYQFPQDEQQNWKMRRPEGKEQEPVREKSDERQIIRMAQPQAQQQPQPGGSKTYHEPVSPPEQWPTAGPRYYEKPSHLSPLDYVKSRIVEAMRTSEEKDGDDKAKESGSPSEPHVEEERKPQGESQPTASSPFAFPYSTIGVHGVCVPPSKPPADEPAPILSSKYEVLSDEDE